MRRTGSDEREYVGDESNDFDSMWKLLARGIWVKISELRDNGML
jgi:hypothetical protein